MPLLMARQQEDQNRVTGHEPVAITPNLPFVACELCRERMSAPPVSAYKLAGTVMHGPSVAARSLGFGLQPECKDESPHSAGGAVLGQRLQVHAVPGAFYGRGSSAICELLCPPPAWLTIPAAATCCAA